jgi:hypothetical protein
VRRGRQKQKKVKNEGADRIVEGGEQWIIAEEKERK